VKCREFGMRYIPTRIKSDVNRRYGASTHVCRDASSEVTVFATQTALLTSGQESPRPTSQLARSAVSTVNLFPRLITFVSPLSPSPVIFATPLSTPPIGRLLGRPLEDVGEGLSPTIDGEGCTRRGAVLLVIGGGTGGRCRVQRHRTARPSCGRNNNVSLNPACELLSELVRLGSLFMFTSDIGAECCSGGSGRRDEEREIA